MHHFKIPKFPRREPSPFLSPISRDTHMASSHQCWPSLLSVAYENYMSTCHMWCNLTAHTVHT